MKPLDLFASASQRSICPASIDQPVVWSPGWAPCRRKTTPRPSGRRHAAEGRSDGVARPGFNAGAILRTHVMRPTWHFVAPADTRWPLALTARAAKRSWLYYSRNGRDRAAPGAADRADKACRRAAAHAGELDQACGRRHSPGQPGPGPHRHACRLDALIWQRPRAASSSRICCSRSACRPSPAHPREALQALTDATHQPRAGPGANFVWWSGLTAPTPKRAWAGRGAGASTPRRPDFWYAESTPAACPRRQCPRTYLLPNYDEYTIAIGPQPFLRMPSIPKPIARDKCALCAHDRAACRIVGTWKRSDERTRSWWK